MTTIDDEEKEEDNGGDDGIAGTVLNTLYALFNLMPEKSIQQIASLFYRWVTFPIPYS